jgi:hypothetical protein
VQSAKLVAVIAVVLAGLHVMAQGQGGGVPAEPPGSAEGLPKDVKPICDMSATDRYKGEDGGLYGGGRNEPPEAHWKAALAESKKIEPLDKDGKPSKDGKVAFLGQRRYAAPRRPGVGGVGLPA